MPLDEKLGSVDIRLAQRLSELRQQKNWSLDDLAQRSSISRASLSRLERAETSPTAVVLGKLCSVYGLTMSRLLNEVEGEPPEFIGEAEQPLWVDPESGFQRRSVSPPAQSYRVEVIRACLPAGASIAYDAPPILGLEQHFYMLSGTLEITVDDQFYRLAKGDCLRFRLFGKTRFYAPKGQDAHYVLTVTPP